MGPPSTTLERQTAEHPKHLVRSSFWGQSHKINIDRNHVWTSTELLFYAKQDRSLSHLSASEEQHRALFKSRADNVIAQFVASETKRSAGLADKPPSLRIQSILFSSHMVSNFIDKLAVVGVV
jgi:hypothetical protein